VIEDGLLARSQVDDQLAKRRLRLLIQAVGHAQAALMLGEDHRVLAQLLAPSKTMPRRAARLVWLLLRMVTEPERPVSVIEIATLGEWRLDTTRRGTKPGGQQSRSTATGCGSFENGDGI
jgi:hypothetical protein